MTTPSSSPTRHRVTHVALSHREVAHTVSGTPMPCSLYYNRKSGSEREVIHIRGCRAVRHTMNHAHHIIVQLNLSPHPLPVFQVQAVPQREVSHRRASNLNMQVPAEVPRLAFRSCRSRTCLETLLQLFGQTFKDFHRIKVPWRHLDPLLLAEEMACHLWGPSSSFIILFTPTSRT